MTLDKLQKQRDAIKQNIEAFGNSIRQAEHERDVLRKGLAEVEQLIAEATAPPVDASARCTTDGKPLDKTIGETGQQQNYVVLCDEERAKGFVRPVRRSYLHVGIRPKYPVRDLTEEQQKDHKGFGYVKFEEYPEGSGGAVGRYWTESQLNSGCQGMTTMGQAIAETWARSPSFYGGTYCCYCKKHLPVEEFVWDGTNDRLGS